MKAKRYLAGNLALTAFIRLSFVNWLNVTHVVFLRGAAIAANNHQALQPCAVNADPALTMIDLPDPFYFLEQSTLTPCPSERKAG